ncbi:hypothetical protein [Acinetobacter sp. Marseille-Q1618]|uniref:hypothetical protein n=1 Tax=Acinetobacter sp. Marseille-Q1618 TaxID=2697502 RepID=UPI00156DBAA2|nr:hypothetical protein [Acinetobacter sp. Marseille-Q1618]
MQKNIQERAAEINRINASKLTKVTTLHDGTKIFPTGTFPNANSRDKNAECAKDGLINYTPKAVVTLSPDTKDATICIAPPDENISHSQSRALAYLSPQPPDQYVNANQILAYEGCATFGNFGLYDQGLVQIYINKTHCYAGTIASPRPKMIPTIE